MTEPLVVWLDQIDRYLRGDLPADHWRSDTVRLVGTIEHDRWNEIMHRDHRPDDELYDAREALRFARVLKLPQPSRDEFARARQQYRDEPEFELGIGKHFVGAKQLQDWYQDIVERLQCHTRSSTA